MSDAYTTWAERHAAAFGLRSDPDAESLLTWVDLFRRSGITPAELNAATDWLALHDPPKWASEHLAALRDTIDRQRRQRLDRTPDAAPDLGECVLCRGGGMVSVPSLKAMQLGQWGTQAVLCRCPLGKWTGDRQGGTAANGERRPRLLTLDDYELLCPNWRTLAADHDDELRRATKPQRGKHAGELDQALEALARRLREMRHDRN